VRGMTRVTNPLGELDPGSLGADPGRSRRGRRPDLSRSVRNARHAHHEMKAAQAAALESARAAALAAPGAIDPEAVLALLRQGHAPTLDNVYAMMARRGA